MKKKWSCLVAILCLTLSCAFMLVGCGEQFIEERVYNLLTLQVIKDNTEFDGYTQFTDHDWCSGFGGMSLEKCTIDVGRSRCQWTYDVSQDYGVKATYDFSVYTGSEVYPAYTFEGYNIYVNGEIANNLTTEQLEGLSSNAQNAYRSAMQFAKICQYGDMSVQLVTQNKSFVANIIILNKADGSLDFMGVLYGY